MDFNDRDSSLLRGNIFEKLFPLKLSFKKLSVRSLRSLNIPLNITLIKSRSDEKVGCESGKVVKFWKILKKWKIED
ncbi:MAG: hypothetical protein Q4D98_13415 [Planctomycetia bacterium]|nr:hypothetical protein [Planctomycetia bacterium]